MYKGQSRFISIKKRQFLLDSEINELNPAGFTPSLTPRQETAQIQESKDQIPELQGVPTTSFVPKTSGAGIFGIGLLAPRPEVTQDYQTAGNSPKNIPIITEPQKYLYFFIEYANVNVARGLESEMVSFAVIIMLNPTTLKECSEMLRLSARKITPLTLKEYLYNSFDHPTYINDQNTPLQFRYAEIPVLKQKTPGRLDNIPLSYPDFDNTPDGIVTRQGPIPAPPYTNFSTGTGSTSAITVSAGATVYFLDTSPMTPWQFAPTGWSWQFGASASPTGSTAQNVLVTFGASGSYTVTLTASNSTGSTTLTRANFVTVV